jgi:hypothetical protein
MAKSPQWSVTRHHRLNFVKMMKHQPGMAGLQQFSRFSN